MFQTSSIPSFNPQVAKIEEMERVFHFTDSGSCTVDRPVSKRVLARKVVGFGTIAILNRYSSGHILDCCTLELMVYKDAPRSENTGLFLGSVTETPKEIVGKTNALDEMRRAIRLSRRRLGRPVGRLC